MLRTSVLPRKGLQKALMVWASALVPGEFDFLVCKRVEGKWLLYQNTRMIRMRFVYAEKRIQDYSYTRNVNALCVIGDRHQVCDRYGGAGIVLGRYVSGLDGRPSVFIRNGNSTQWWITKQHPRLQN